MYFYTDLSQQILFCIIYVIDAASTHGKVTYRSSIAHGRQMNIDLEGPGTVHRAGGPQISLGQRK